MSKKKRKISNAVKEVKAKDQKRSQNDQENKIIDKKSFWKGLGGIEKFGIIGLCMLLVGGVLGSGLGSSIINSFTAVDSNSKTSVHDRNSSNKSEPSILSKLNPFASAPSPTPTPQLSKEYIYAGSRMLAVEDANATAAPPADLAIWRPSSGTWWVMGGVGSQQTTQQWGANDDIPVQGDYDGDGKTDFAVFRPSNNQWYIVNSSDNSNSGAQFGTAGDKPVPADFDGDGRTDIVVYRPSTGTWYILQSSDNQVDVQAFGISTDIPNPADHDGDGKADISVWRDSDKKFYSLQSSNAGYVEKLFTQNSTKPVSADYDGDGQADFAIRNGDDWIILNSSTSQFQTINWQSGSGSDRAVHNDYDGDGKVDVATWKNSSGVWSIRQSSDSKTRTETWGIPGDIPVPAYYRR